MTSQHESHDDVIGRQNIEGDRGAFLSNQRKIAYVIKKANKFINGITSACDIGIGNGYTMRLFNSRGVKTTGVDISQYLVNHLQKQFLKELSLYFNRALNSMLA